MVSSGDLCNIGSVFAIFLLANRRVAAAPFASLHLPSAAQLFLINSQVYFLKYGPLSRLDASLTLGVSFSLFQLSPVEKRLLIVFLGPSTSFALA